MRRPRNPNRPQGIGSSTPQPRGRRPGFKPDYNPEQTAQYKSQALRYAKAVELANAGPDFVQFNGEILSSDNAEQLRNKGNEPFEPTDRLLFLYASKRAPLDYWTVTYGGGGLAAIDSFTGEVELTGDPPDCPEPIAAWSWENPEFNWSADGIRRCEGEPDPGGSDGRGGIAGPTSMPGPWYPVPAGETRTVVLQLLPPTRFDWYIDPPRSTGELPNPSDPFVIDDSDYVETIFTDLTGVETEIAQGFNSVAAAGSYTIAVGGSFFAIDYADRYAVAEVNPDAYGTRFETYVLFSDGPLNPFPPGSDSPGEVPEGVPSPLPESPFPPLPSTDSALAGGVWQSVIFTLDAPLEVKVKLTYTTVAGLGAPSGAIAVALYTSEDVLLDSFGETPTEGGFNELEHTFSLTAGQFYFKITIPTTCYCDRATVRIGGAGFECNCPDFTRRQDFIVNSPYNSEQIDRDWTTSEAGCDTEVGCKHITGTKLWLGMPVDVPTDYPY